MDNDRRKGERRMRLVATGEELVDVELLVTDEQFRALVRVADRTPTGTVTDVIRRYITEGLAREP